MRTLAPWIIIACWIASAALLVASLFPVGWPVRSATLTGVMLLAATVTWTGRYLPSRQ